MDKVDKVVQFFQDRVERYGAPYYTFAIFGLINYPIAYAFEHYSGVTRDSFFLRLLATMLCLFLLVQDFWPRFLKRFVPIYWYMTVTFCLPALGTFLLLRNSGSLEWLVNYSIGILILILVVDWLMFLFIYLVGAGMGVILFSLYYPAAPIWQADSHTTSVAIYLYTLVCLMAGVFARNREMFNAKLLLIKERLNKKLERQVVSRTSKLEEVVKHKNYFLNNVNHEIRTFVQIISNVSSGLSADWSTLDDARKKYFVQQLDKSSGKLLGLINNVLDLSKFDSGKMLFDMKVNNMEEVVKEIVEELQILANDKGIKIDFYKNKYIETRTLFDKERMSQVVRNLITNAIKYSPHNSKVRVDLIQKYATLPTDITINGLCISVRDEGVGIPKSELKTIFEPFKGSSKTTSVKVSTGLGLSISLEIVTAHSGVLWAESTEGNGSVFYCVLPYPNNRLSKDEDKSAKKKFHIVFVDDEEGCRVAGRMILENIGYSIKTCASGTDLLDYLKYTRRKIDLILVDMLMPDMEGIDAVRKIRLDSKYKEVPIILQTGIKYDIDLPELEKLSPLGYISKPYNKEQLRIEVEKFLGA